MKSISQIIEDQVHRWQLQQKEKPAEKTASPVVTISREPGSGGRIVAQRLAETLGFEVFHQEVLHEMAKRAEVSEQLLATLDEKGLSILEDWIASLVNDRHLWPDQYLQHLMNVIGTIGKHGRAVVVGRGANFVLPPEKRISLRVISPLETRIRNVSQAFGVAVAEARSRILKTESDRKAFIKKYFNEDIQDPLNYDLIINTEGLSIDDAANAVAGTLGHFRRT